MAGDRAEKRDALLWHDELEGDRLTRRRHRVTAVVEHDVVLDRAVVDEHTLVGARLRGQITRAEHELRRNELHGVTWLQLGQRCCALTRSDRASTRHDGSVIGAGRRAERE